MCRKSTKGCSSSRVRWSCRDSDSPLHEAQRGKGLTSLAVIFAKGNPNAVEHLLEQPDKAKCGEAWPREELSFSRFLGWQWLHARHTVRQLPSSPICTAAPRQQVFSGGLTSPYGFRKCCIRSWMLKLHHEVCCISPHFGYISCIQRAEQEKTIDWR